MTYKDLPGRWKNTLKAYINQEFGEDRETLHATDFKYDLKMTLADGSLAFFHYAFYIIDEDEVAVFTEHCGYHLFPLDETTLVLYEQQ